MLLLNYLSGMRSQHEQNNLHGEITGVTMFSTKQRKIMAVNILGTFWSICVDKG